MHKRAAAAWLIIWGVATAGVAQAAPGSGFAVFGGFASHNSSGKITKGALTGQTFSLSSSGLSIGGDYQFALSDAVSLNLLLASSSESVSSDELAVDTTGHGILGVEGRLWFNELFIGAHFGNYSEVLIESSSGLSVSLSGFGTGFIVGWESPEGLFLSGQVDQAALTAADAEADLSGVRVQIGYRWK
ncbi:MAG: hypothetical protein HY342_07325 [Candidatus Lambdaproteobacteria bacterium]|nr:hypothetical protein [Candidatus Lambdaproteobacteria bacterium]